MVRRRSSSNSFQKRFLGWGKICLLGAIVVTVFLVSMIIGMRISVRGTQVETPALVGMKLSDAEALFEKIDLKLSVTGRRFDLSIPEGAILSQVPGPDTRSKINGNVQVIVSLGRRTRPVPELRGNSLRAARLLLEQQGYQVGRVSDLPVLGGKDQVVAQWPRPDAEAPGSDRVDVLVETELKGKFVMPDLTGENLNRALMILDGLGFEGRVYYQDSPGMRRGSIVRQFPEPGYPVFSAQMVNLEVAR
jgi:beta-lactam-binding protein with PASTA domain